MHFHSAAQPLRGEGGSLQYIKHMQVTRAAKANATWSCGCCGGFGMLVSAVPPLHDSAPSPCLFQRMSHDWYWQYGDSHGDFCGLAKAVRRCVLL